MIEELSWTQQHCMIIEPLNGSLNKSICEFSISFQTPPLSAANSLQLPFLRPIFSTVSLSQLFCFILFTCFLSYVLSKGKSHYVAPTKTHPVLPRLLLPW